MALSTFCGTLYRYCVESNGTYAQGGGDRVGGGIGAVSFAAFCGRLSLWLKANNYL